MWHCKRKRTRTRFKHDMPLYVMVRWNYFTSKIASTAEACKCRCMYFFFEVATYYVHVAFISSFMCSSFHACVNLTVQGEIIGWCVWWRMCDVNFGVIFVVTHHKFKVSSCVGVWNRLLAFFFMFVVDGGKLMKNWLLRELFCGIPENHTHTHSH